MAWYYIEGIITLAGINIMVVLGLSLLTGFTGLFSFGHAGFMAVGAYTAAWLSKETGVPFPIAIIAGGIAAMLVSFIIGGLTLNLKGDYFCIATLGFGEAIRLILDNVQFLGGARGMTSIPMKSNLVSVYSFVAVGIIFMYFFIRSRHGRNMIAIREEELASQAIGINVFKYKMMSLAMSAMYAGIGGALWAHYLTFINPFMFNLAKSTEMTIMVIIGGLGSITGSVLGTFLLTSLPEVFREFTDWRLVIYGAVVIVVMIARPRGLMGGMEFSPKGIVNFFRGRTGKKARSAGAEVQNSGERGAFEATDDVADDAAGEAVDMKAKQGGEA